jgi:SIR2-like domain
VGCRVLAALLASGLARAVFTTNFDTVLERAIAEVSGRSLAAYHVEGAKSANKALNNEEFPLYCKLHGDFRYDSIKNLKEDLSIQNADLSQCLTNAANRFGFIVAGYSGRDESIITLLRSVLSTPNPFPNGLYWTRMKQGWLASSVHQLMADAKDAGVDSAIVEVETFDPFMLRLWRNIENKDQALDANVRKSRLANVNIPQPNAGKGAIVRMSALPITSLPGECLALEFESPKEWPDLRAATRDSEGQLILTKADTVLCWGSEPLIRKAFKDVVSVKPYDLTSSITDLGNNHHVKRFLEDALCQALIRGKPLVTRNTRHDSFLIVDRHSTNQSAFSALHAIVGKIFGEISGLFTPVDDEHPHPEKVAWAEAVRISIDVVNGRCWLLFDPDVWIWPNRARRVAAEFLDQRRGDRFNNVYNALVDAWLAAVLQDGSRNSEIKVSLQEGGAPVESPSFVIGTRTAYSRKLMS